MTGIRRSEDIGASGRASHVDRLHSLERKDPDRGAIELRVHEVVGRRGRRIEKKPARCCHEDCANDRAPQPSQMSSTRRHRLVVAAKAGDFRPSAGCVRSAAPHVPRTVLRTVLAGRLEHGAAASFGGRFRWTLRRAVLGNGARPQEPAGGRLRKVDAFAAKVGARAKAPERLAAPAARRTWIARGSTRGIVAHRGRGITAHDDRGVVAPCARGPGRAPTRAGAGGVAGRASAEQRNRYPSTPKPSRELTHAPNPARLKKDLRSINHRLCSKCKPKHWIRRANTL
jgi:hypothetical protein